MVKDYPEKIKPGFSFAGEILIDQEQELLIVEKRAVREYEDNYFVMIQQKDKKPERKQITIAEYDKTYYQVISGLKEGDVLVVLGNSRRNSDEDNSDAPFGLPLRPPRR